MRHFFSRAVFCTLFFTLLSAPLFAPVSTPAAAQAAADDAALLHGISRYFTSIPAFTARFSQINPSGDLVRGVMHYQRPGQIAFIYDPPNQLRVVVDATHIHVQENARATPDSYAIDATPLPLFFAPDLDCIALAWLPISPAPPARQKFYCKTRAAISPASFI